MNSCLNCIEWERKYAWRTASLDVTEKELVRVTQQNQALVAALRNLKNEASGFLGLSDIQRHGHTNSRILRLRIEEAGDAIVEAAKAAPKGEK